MKLKKNFFFSIYLINLSFFLLFEFFILIINKWLDEMYLLFDLLKIEICLTFLN